MATSGSRSGPQLLVDTSVAVALMVADHRDHQAAVNGVGSRRRGLAGHAAFDTFSVLTRLPAPARRTPATVARMLTTNFPHTRFFGTEAATVLLAELPGMGIAGGPVYDALVARRGGRARARHSTPRTAVRWRPRMLRVEVELLA